MAAPVARRLFTVTDYHRMAEAGILTEDDRVELIEGEIVKMTAIGAPHAACVNALTELVMEQVERRARVSVQNPVGLSDISEPEPDISVIRRRDYRKALPTHADVYLVIEV